MDAGSVAAGEGEPVVCPGNPRRGGLELWAAGERGVVIFFRDRINIKNRRVPGAADDGDACKPFFFCFADGPAHPGFAQRLILVMGQRLCRSKFAHRIANGGEQPDIAVAIVFDDVLPPTFAVVESGRTRQLAQRIESDGRRGRRCRRYTVGCFCFMFGARARDRSLAAWSSSADSTASSASRWHCGRSMNLAVTPLRLAQRRACHSGENSAKG